MANENEIPLNITADASDAQKSILGFQKTVEKSIVGINASFLAVAAAAAAAAVVVQRVFTEAIKEASEADQNVQALNFALAATGQFSEEASQGMQDFASAIQDTTAFTDDAVLQSLTLAKTFGLTNDKAKELVTSATDLAAVQGIQLTSATDKLLASLNGQGKSLKDLGPQFAKLTEEQLANGEAITKVSQRFGGAASILSGTFSGALSQANNQLGEVYESLGRTITQNPAVIKAISLIAEAFRGIAKGLEANKGGISTFFAFLINGAAEVADLVVNGFAIVATGFLELGKAAGRAASLIEALFKASTGDFKGAKFAMDDFATSGNKFVRTLDGIETGLDSAAKFTRKAADSIDVLGNSSKKTKSAIKNQADGFGGYNEALGKTVEEARKFAKDLLKDSLDPIEKAQIARDEDLQKIRSYVKKRALTLSEGDDAIFAAEKKFSKVVNDFREKNIQKQLDDEKNLKAKLKAQIESASTNGFEFVINAVRFDPAALEDIHNQIALGVGAIKSVLGGKDGAKEFVATAAGSIADAFLPGIGPVVKEITKTLALGPEAVKELVREFVNELPNVIVAIADAAPAFVEAFVDSMVTKGGAAKIAVALAKALYLSVPNAVGKQMAVAFNNFNREAFLKTARDAAIILSVPFLGAIYVFRNEILSAFKNATAQIPAAFANAGAAISSSIGSGIGSAINAAIGDFSSIRNAIGDSANYMQAVLRNAIGDAANGMQDSIRRAIGDSANYMQDRLRTALGDSAEYLKDKIKEALSFGGGGGGGGGILSGLGLATGGLVPPGYPNDTFPARLTSGELVIPKDLVTSLADFIDVGIAPRESGSDVNSALLARIASLLAQPINVESNVSVSGQAFADIMLRLSRNNARLAV